MLCLKPLCPCTPSMSKRMTYDFVSRKWQFFFKNQSSFIELQKILTMISCHRQYSLHRKFLRSMLRNMWWYAMASKVEKILKCSLDLIPSPSPSVKIQIMAGKFAWGWNAKHCRQCFALLPQVNFPANNLNFHRRWRWWDRIQAIFLNPFYFTKMKL